MTTNPPNIILLMTDQQRADTIHALGHEHMITPGMDRLVQKGMSFTRNFACGATCIA
ncbi:MAG: sulfatase-like hydrolase/transferase, partial [Anaerolineae bacterium]|nr:sulfatase-like hydrolase/transferase [Anaerolineae bacterium]